MSDGTGAGAGDPELEPGPSPHGVTQALEALDFEQIGMRASGACELSRDGAAREAQRSSAWACCQRIADTRRNPGSLSRRRKRCSRPLAFNLLLGNHGELYGAVFLLLLTASTGRRIEV